MRKYFVLAILSFVLAIPQLSYSQEKKPKVALVLSGGGAKGVAHIPLLQKLDSLGIVPDIVIGTSMGSIVGGLYAMGYSGDSIANITKTIDWDVVLGGTITLDDVSVEEKSEYKRYLVDFDVVKGKPKMSSAILSDQELRELFSVLTYPVYSVTDFDDLSIPFRAMTTDIVNGKEVFLGEGSLSMAMRSSMSIPGVFKPVPYKGVLLVDGGVVNNFPVDRALAMGYDFVIGSDVGGGMQSMDKLNSIPALAFQAGMLTSNLKNPVSRSQCNILVDHMPNLTYSTGDFDKSSEIFEQGKIAANTNLDALVALANQLKGFEQRIHKLPVAPEHFVLDTIIYTGISESNLELVKARANIQTGVEYTPDDLINGINRAMGTTLFSQITFNKSEDFSENKKGIEINGLEHARHQVKGSLHYDTYQGVGLVANYTGRNVLGKSSRLIASVDIAEQPKAKLQYQKNFGKQKEWWWRSEVQYERLKQKLFIEGNFAEDLKFHSFYADNQVNKNINSLNSYVGFGLIYNYSKLKPTKDPDFSDNVLDLEHYFYNNISIYAHYEFNNLDLVFYPTKGTYFKGGIGRSVLSDVDFKPYNDEDPSVQGNTNGFTKLNLDFEKRFDFSKKVTGVLAASGNFIFEDDLKDDEVSFTDYGYAGKYFLGGNLLSGRKNSFDFPGLYDSELNVTQMMELGLGVQFNPMKSFYLTPHYNIASIGFGDFGDYIDDAFSPKGDWQYMYETSMLMSAGVTLSYHSFLGPINFDVSWVNDIDKVRVFFSVGLLFN